MDGLRFVSNLVHVKLASDPVRRSVVNLHVVKVGFLDDHFVSIAVRIELFLIMVDFPIQST